MYHDQGRLFIDASTASPKAVLLHKSYAKPFVPLVYAGQIKVMEL